MEILSEEELVRRAEKLKERQREAERLFYVLWAQISAQQQRQEQLAFETILGTIEDMLSLGKQEKKAEREEPELTWHTPEEKMALQSELKTLKEVDERMAVDYEKALGQKEMLMVECAECMALPNASIQKRLLEEREKKSPDPEKLALYQQLLEAGGDGKLKERIFHQVKENREEALKSFFLSPEKEGESPRLTALTERNQREQKLKRALGIRKPLSFRELVEEETREREKQSKEGFEKQPPMEKAPERTVKNGVSPEGKPRAEGVLKNEANGASSNMALPSSPKVAERAPRSLEASGPELVLQRPK